MALITAENLTLCYGQKTVVKNLSFSLHATDRILVCGENGSGKSTLLRALVGSHPLKEGRVQYAEGVRDKLGYLPQKEEQDDTFPASAREIAVSGLRRRSLFLTKEQKARVKEALALFGAEDLQHTPFSALSGGQRQRILLARALLSADAALLLDEPVTGLDPLVTRELYLAIQTVSKEGLGVLFVSHDISGALEFCTHVLHLSSDGHSHFYKAEEYKNSAHFCALCSEVHHV